MKSSYKFLVIVILIGSSVKSFGQDFLNRNYLQSFPGANIKSSSTNDEIDNANRRLFKPNFLNAIKNVESKEQKTNLQLKHENRITVAPIWRLSGDSIVYHLKEDSIRQKNIKNTKLTGTTNKDAAGTLYSELLTDFTGLWRLSLASAVTATAKEDSFKTDDGSVKDIQNFFVGGGNIIVKGSLPLVLFYNTKFRHTRNTGIYFVPKAGVSFPALGTSANDPTWNLDAGIETEMFGGGVTDQIGFYGRLRIAGVWASRDFTKQILSDDRRLFSYGQANVGVLMQEKIFININFPVSLPTKIFGKDDPIDRIPVSVSAGVLISR